MFPLELYFSFSFRKLQRTKSTESKYYMREHAFTIEYEETDANFSDQNVQRHSVTSLENARSLANGPVVEGAEGKFPGNCCVSYLSLAMVALEESVGGA